MLTVKGKLNGKDAVFLLDTGATTEFVDTEFAKAAQLVVTASDATIRLADGEKVGSAGITGTVQYALQLKGGGETKFNSKFEVTQLGGMMLFWGCRGSRRRGRGSCGTRGRCRSK
jgi:Aspartyl protease